MFDPIKWLAEYRLKHLGEDHHSLCPFCKHLKEDYSCTAFPNGIPEVYLRHDIFHLERDPKQEGDVVFELNSKFK